MPHPATSLRQRLRPGLWSWPDPRAALSSPGVSVNGVTWTFEIAFGPADGPLRAAGACQWYDVTGYVRGFNSRRGRTTELTGYSPGTATVTLDNTTRVFDASNTAGPYYGKLTPMRRFRASAAIGATSAVLFSGFITGWPISYPGMFDSEVEVHAVDGFRVLEQAELPGSAYEATIATDGASYYWPMQSLSQSSFDPSIGTIPLQDLGGRGVVVSSGSPLIDAPALVYGVTAVAANASPTSPAASIEIVASSTATYPAPLVDLTWRSVANGMLMNLNFYSDQIAYSATSVAGSYSGSGTYSTSAINGTAALITFTVTPAGVGTLYINGQSVSVTMFPTTATTVTSNPTFGSEYFRVAVNVTPGIGYVSNASVYPVALTADQVARHYLAGTNAYGHPMGERTGERVGRILDSIGWPSADRAISTGTTVCDQWLPASGSALAGCRACEDTEQGAFFIAADGDATFRDRQWQWTDPRAITSQATLTDVPGAGIPYRDVEVDGGSLDYIKNDITVSYTGGSVREKDPNATFLEAESISTVIPATGGWLARQLAKYRLRAHKDPAVRVPSVVMRPEASPSTFAPLLSLDLGDRVTVVRAPTGGSGTISADVAIQGISHSIRPGVAWEVGFYLAPPTESYSEGGYLLVGSATAGVVGERSPRVIPY